MLPIINRKDYMQSILDDFFGTNEFATQRNSNIPAVNVKKNDKEFLIEVAAPGLDKKDFDITLENNVLTISSEVKSENEEKQDDFIRREFHYAGFRRSFTIPEGIDEEQIEAKHNNGVLVISIPKKSDEELNKQRQIEIK